MANNLATTGSGHNALQITQQYPAERFNLLVPMQTVAEIARYSQARDERGADFHQRRTRKSTSRKRARRNGRGRTGKHHPAKPAGWALTKKGLNKLMRAAGIKILNTRRWCRRPARSARRSTRALAAR